MEPLEFAQLVELLRQIPGLSAKQAKLAALALVRQGAAARERLGQIQTLLEGLHCCRICGQLSQHDLCNICQSNSRSRQLLIVEAPEQIDQFERERLFTGKYYVVPLLFNKRFEVQPFDFRFLIDYVSHFDEVILALSPVAAGLLTANLIVETLRAQSTIVISQLATGVPLGSKLDYVDPLTLAQALRHRKEID